MEFRQNCQTNSSWTPLRNSGGTPEGIPSKTSRETFGRTSTGIFIGMSRFIEMEHLEKIPMKILLGFSVEFLAKLSVELLVE